MHNQLATLQRENKTHLSLISLLYTDIFFMPDCTTNCSREIQAASLTKASHIPDNKHVPEVIFKK